MIFVESKEKGLQKTVAVKNRPIRIHDGYTIARKICQIHQFPCFKCTSKSVYRMLLSHKYVS